MEANMVLCRRRGSSPKWLFLALCSFALMCHTVAPQDGDISPVFADPSSVVNDEFRETNDEFRETNDESSAEKLLEVVTLEGGESTPGMEFDADSIAGFGEATQSIFRWPYSSRRGRENPPSDDSVFVSVKHRNCDNFTPSVLLDNHIQMYPLPIKPGHHLWLKTTGTLSQKLEKATFKLQLQVTLPGGRLAFPVPPIEIDYCAQPGATCPQGPGPFLVMFNYAVPSIAVGHVQAIAKVYSTDSDPIACMQIIDQLEIKA